MSQEQNRPRRRRRRDNTQRILKRIIEVMLVLLVIVMAVDLMGPARTADPTETTGKHSGGFPWWGGTEETTEPTEPPITKVSTVTIGAMGDVLMHKPVIETGQRSDGTYDYESIFRYLAPYSQKLDYAAANLETTLAGNNNGYDYNGYPCFNCPDAIVDDLVDAGFDLLLTANNHCYDTRMVGYQRTLEVSRAAGLQTLGTMANAEEPKYAIVDVGGIKIGMICYTYETSDGTGTYPALNGIPMSKGSYDMINTFRHENPEPFYKELEGYLAEMEAAGVDATVLYIHWGVEYQLDSNDQQEEMAQRICDLGVDVIIGGHPHVVQPMDLLESTVDPDHKTVCLYSMGNAVSNQRTGKISYAPDYYTEDGVMMTVTFTKYSDGTVYVEDTDILPMWVNLRSVSGGKEYNILPLDDDTRSQWKTTYEMTDSQFSAAEKSYDRTMGIVGEGLAECRDYLAQEKAQRDAAYGITE